MRWIVIILAVAEAGWMLFDGVRALTVGDYFTPSSGEHAGRLGPWAGLVSAAGINPRSTPMKTFFVLYGVIWLVFVVAFALHARWAWAGMLGAAVCSLWYLPVGTLLSIIQIVLLLLPALRAYG